MSLEVTRKIEFDAAHRVVGHGGKCINLHGHRYVAEITVCAAYGDKLDALDMVIDFSVIKSVVGAWVDEHWDHGCLLNSEDPLLLECHSDDHARIFGPKEVNIFTNCNPTAEVLAQTLFGVARTLLDAHPIIVQRVRLYETPNCWADYSE